MRLTPITLLVLRDAGDKSAAKAMRTWLSLAKFQAPEVGLVVECWWTASAQAFHTGLVWNETPSA